MVFEHIYRDNSDGCLHTVTSRDFFKLRVQIKKEKDKIKSIVLIGASNHLHFKNILTKEEKHEYDTPGDIININIQSLFYALEKNKAMKTYTIGACM